MERRTAGVLIGLLAVVCFGLILSAVFPFATSEPHAANPPSERFTVSDSEAYSASGSIVVDGQVRLAFDGVVTADGAWYQRVVDDNVVSEAYQPTADGTVYRRLTIEGREDATQHREQITEDEDSVLVRADRDGDNVTFVVEENSTGSTQPVSGTASVFVNSLFVAGYETAEAGSSAVTVYEPQAGWYDGRERYRITDASGDVRADADTHVVESANVSWDVTVPAGTYTEYALRRLVADEPTTYTEYALRRLVTDEPTTYRITFEFDSDDPDLERPPWAGEADSA